MDDSSMTLLQMSPAPRRPQTPTLPQLSPAQRRPQTPAKSTWSGVLASWDSARSTAASDASSDSECLGEASRDFCSSDVAWLLAALSKDQQAHLDRTQFQRECQRVFRIMDKDSSGFLNRRQIADVIAHLIPDHDKAIGSRGSRRVGLSVQSVLSAFDKDSDGQLSSEEFPEFVRFCYAWKCQQDRLLPPPEPISVIRPSSSPASSGTRSAPLLFPSGKAHGLVRSASLLQPPSGNLLQPPASSSKSMHRSASNPTVRKSASRSGGSSRTPSPQPMTTSAASWHSSQSTSASSSRRPSTSASNSRFTSPEPLLGSARSSKPSSRATSVGSSRRPSKSTASKPAVFHRPPSPPVPIRREDLAMRQMQAVKALIKELLPSYETLLDLVSALMHNVMEPKGNQAFSKETINNVCELVLSGGSLDPEEEFAPRTNGGTDQAPASQIESFLQDLGHSADEAAGEEGQALMNQALEALALLSMRWFAMKNMMAVPELSEYQRRSWLPPAFSVMVGQIIWRHRTAESLQPHTAVVENLRWITLTPGVEEDMMDRCNSIFRLFSGAESTKMRLSQWRKVMDIIASNPSLRQRVRRCDAVRACYGDALSHTDNGMSRKQFKLMVMKTADLMAVHPIVLFQELASKAASLEAAQKLKEEASEPSKSFQDSLRPASR